MSHLVPMCICNALQLVHAHCSVTVSLGSFVSDGSSVLTGQKGCQTIRREHLKKEQWMMNRVASLLPVIRAWRCSNVTMHWKPASFCAQVWRWTPTCLCWTELVATWEKWRLHLFVLFVHFNSVDDHSFVLFWFVLATAAVSPSHLRHLSLPLAVIVVTVRDHWWRHPSHDVCALLCKLMVVDVCLLLMYIHYESCLRHSVSLSLSLWAPALLLDQFLLAKN